MHVPIWGVNPSSGSLELIDIQQAKSVHFGDGARTLTIGGESPAVFTDLQVATKDFQAVVDVVSHSPGSVRLEESDLLPGSDEPRAPRKSKEADD